LFLYGATDKHIDVAVVGDFFLLGIRLTPWAFCHLDGVPSGRIANQTIPLNHIFDKIGKSLKEKLIDQTDPKKRIRQVNDFLERIQKHKSQIKSTTPPQLGEIFRGCGDVSVAEITNQCLLSRRQIERKFRGTTGISPKKYLRIARFQKALTIGNGIQSLTDLAYRLGYSDQAHFTKEFKSHSGITPKEYFHKRKFSFVVDSFLKNEA
jgi:AraC-like DNA-binding protein